jgi:hypothetical protein
MSLACEINSTVIPSAAVAMFICGIEIPVEKVELKKHAKKTETTCSVSFYNGQLWEEYAPGPSGGTVNWDSKWRVGQAVTPPSVRPGGIYPIAVYVRRPFFNGPTDPGSAFSMNLFVDDNSLTLDPKAGVIDWKCSGTATGPILDPA